MNKIKSGLFYYSALVAVFITLTQLFTASSTTLPLIFIFLPVTLYFVFTLVTSRHPSLKKRYADPLQEIILSRSGAIASLVILIFLSLTTLYRLVSKPSPESPQVSVLPAANLTASTDSSPQPYIQISLPDPNASINIRKSASTSADIIATAKHLDKYLLLNSQADWYQIELSPGLTGWLNHQAAYEIFLQP